MKTKAERDTIRSVREQAMERDQGCRFPRHPAWPCDGPLEMAHLEAHRRAKTGGQAPEDRHTLSGVAMLCRRHHGLYDGRDVRVRMDDEDGSNAYMSWMEKRTGNLLGVTFPRMANIEQ